MKIRIRTGSKGVEAIAVDVLGDLIRRDKGKDEPRLTDREKLARIEKFAARGLRQSGYPGAVARGIAGAFAEEIEFEHALKRRKTR